MNVMTLPSVTAIIPAAGVGSRMNAEHPKQYLSLAGKPILSHTVELLLSHPQITKVIVALSPEDRYFNQLDIAAHPDVTRVEGGKERADSVLNALNSMKDNSWALVHDAARPCVPLDDISSLLSVMSRDDVVGGILATPVRDTMKRAHTDNKACVSHTESRENLWHALTPQLFPNVLLQRALSKALSEGVAVTDEASAIEYVGENVALIDASPINIKITHPADLPLAEFYLHQRMKAKDICE